MAFVDPAVPFIGLKLIKGNKDPQIIDITLDIAIDMAGDWLAWVDQAADDQGQPMPLTIRALNVKHGGIQTLEGQIGDFPAVSEDGLVLFLGELGGFQQLRLWDVRADSVVDFAGNLPGGFDGFIDGPFVVYAGGAALTLYDHRSGENRPITSVAFPSLASVNEIAHDPVVVYSVQDFNLGVTGIFVDTTIKATFEILGESVRGLDPRRLRKDLKKDLKRAEQDYKHGRDANAIAHLEEFVEDVAESGLSNSDKAGLSRVAQALITALQS